MDTERLHIRRFQEEDLHALHALLSDADVMKYLEAPYTKEMTERFLFQCGISDPPLIYAVEDREKTFVGYVIYHPYDQDSYEIGWVLHKNQWGKGYASELMQRLIEDARGRTSKLLIECAPAQEITKRIARRHHFTLAEAKDDLELYILCLKSGVYTESQ